MNDATRQPLINLSTLALTEPQREFLLTHGCTLEEGRLSVQVSCPSGTTREDLGIEGEETGQGKGHLFLVTFPDGMTCQDWYFPTGESHLILSDDKQIHGDIPLKQSEVDALQIVLRAFIASSPNWEQLSEVLLDRFENLSSSPDGLTPLPMAEEEFILLYTGLAAMILPLQAGFPVEEDLRGPLQELQPLYERIKRMVERIQVLAFERSKQ